MTRENRQGCPDSSPAAGDVPGRKRRKIPVLVWIMLVWALVTWGLWVRMMRPEIPPLDKEMLALADGVHIDLAADAWSRDYLARLEEGDRKYTDPDHRDAHKVLCIREARRAGRLDVACATARSIEGTAKRDEVLSELIPEAAANCDTLPLAVWSALRMSGKDARIPVHTLLNDRWDACPR